MNYDFIYTYVSHWPGLKFFNFSAKKTENYMHMMYHIVAD